MWLYFASDKFRAHVDCFQARNRFAYKIMRALGRAPLLVTDSDYIVETKSMTALTRPPQGDFLCYASVNRGGKMLHPSSDVSGLIGDGSRYVGHPRAGPTAASCSWFGRDRSCRRWELTNLGRRLEVTTLLHVACLCWMPHRLRVGPFTFDVSLPKGTKAHVLAYRALATRIPITPAFPTHFDPLRHLGSVSRLSLTARLSYLAAAKRRETALEGLARAAVIIQRRDIRELRRSSNDALGQSRSKDWDTLALPQEMLDEEAAAAEALATASRPDFVEVFELEDVPVFLLPVRAPVVQAAHLTGQWASVVGHKAVEAMADVLHRGDVTGGGGGAGARRRGPPVDRNSLAAQAKRIGAAHDADDRKRELSTGAADSSQWHLPEDKATRALVELTAFAVDQ